MESDEKINEYKIYLGHKEIAWGLAGSIRQAKERFVKLHPEYEDRNFTTLEVDWKPRYLHIRTNLLEYDKKLYQMNRYSQRRNVEFRNTYLSILSYYEKWFSKETLKEVYGGK